MARNKNPRDLASFIDLSFCLKQTCNDASRARSEQLIFFRTEVSAPRSVLLAVLTNCIAVEYSCKGRFKRKKEYAINCVSNIII
jgi:hypothetical protein